jgi:hypothetical protein
MFEKDYLMRQLMALLEALQRIIRRRKEGDFTLALEVKDEDKVKVMV